MSLLRTDKNINCRVDTEADDISNERQSRVNKINNNCNSNHNSYNEGKNLYQSRFGSIK